MFGVMDYGVNTAAHKPTRAFIIPEPRRTTTPRFIGNPEDDQ